MRVKPAPKAIKPALKAIVESLEYDSDLPAEWRLPSPEKFSQQKTLFEYQQTALKNAAKALFLYYDKQLSNERSKQTLLESYQQDINFRHGDYVISPKDTAYKIYKKYLPTAANGNIEFVNIINRMSFWMATGSGKTPVIVKLAAYVETLKKTGKIPQHNTLLFAPSEHALKQIKNTVQEFNAAGGMQLELSHLREFGKAIAGLRFNDTARVYWCRSDHLAEGKKDVLLNWRDYDNNGKWYVFLDEAHKGDTGDSKRKAYYTLLARNGFLFNFSATFVDAEDIVTAVAQYNLSDFIANGHGKKILLANSSFAESTELLRDVEFLKEKKQSVVLESLIALAVARDCAQSVRDKTGGKCLYHMPLMMTLVNAVNTEGHKNDLLIFFEILRGIAGRTINKELFNAAKKKLRDDWQNGTRMFEEGNGGYAPPPALQNMTIEKMRKLVLGSERRGELEYIEGRDKKQIAFKLKTADAPFALMKIGDITKWTRDFLAGMEHAKGRENSDWFARLEEAENFSILMGSRAFFESWDSTRPNIINFINIGKNKTAKIFVSQSVGRGVRVSPLAGQRKRLEKLPQAILAQKQISREEIAKDVAPLETLILYATNKEAVDVILEGMKNEAPPQKFVPLKGLVKNPPSPLLPLLVPIYKDIKHTAKNPPPFRASAQSLQTLRRYAKRASESMLTVACGLSFTQIDGLQTVAANSGNINDDNYGLNTMLAMFHERGNDDTEKMADGVREINDTDIVHFRRMEVSLSQSALNDLRDKISKIAEDKAAAEKKNDELTEKLQNKTIQAEEFKKKYKTVSHAESAEFINDGCTLTIKRCAKHYYLPLLIAEHGRPDFIRHIIKEPSEVAFMKHLENWLANNEPQWDEWMFCKLNETHDKVYIPYRNNNRAARFFPDFIFWMKRGKKYQIVFVDPKGMEHTNYQRKLDGYSNLFVVEKSDPPREFSKDGTTVQVKMLFYNPKAAENAPDEYSRFWTNTPADIFANAYPNQTTPLR